MGFTTYPLLVWFGLEAWSPRVVALVMLVVLVPTALARLGRPDRAQLAGLAVLPLVTIVALALAAVLNSRGHVLMVPVAINLALLVAFGSTLRPGAHPMIERFARLQSPELDEAQQAWCRLWTRIWCAFFVVNGSTALALALLAPVSWWAFYNGLLAYVAIGTLLGTEWLLRRRRFSASTDARGPGLARQQLQWRDEALSESAGVTTRVCRTRIPRDYRYFEGHFPGYPVLAGVVQLHELVLPCLRRSRSDLGDLTGLSGLKFPDRIQPGQDVEVLLRWEHREPLVAFEILRDGRRCTLGKLAFGAASSSP